MFQDICSFLLFKLALPPSTLKLTCLPIVTQTVQLASLSVLHLHRCDGENQDSLFPSGDRTHNLYIVVLRAGRLWPLWIPPVVWSVSAAPIMDVASLWGVSALGKTRRWKKRQPTSPTSWTQTTRMVVTSGSHCLQLLP